MDAALDEDDGTGASVTAMAIQERAAAAGLPDVPFEAVVDVVGARLHHRDNS